eukprot:5027238-Amphidinium_carterae.1
MGVKGFTSLGVKLVRLSKLAFFLYKHRFGHGCFDEGLVQQAVTIWQSFQHARGQQLSDTGAHCAH